MSRAQRRLTRRRFLRTTAAVTVAAGLGPTTFVRRAPAKAATLTIAQRTHFVPAFEDWFDLRFTKEWGDRNGVRVVVDHLSLDELRDRAATEIAAKRGHDLFGLPTPPAAFESHVLPLNDIVSECERRLGKLVRLAHQGTYNPKTQKYFAFCDHWVPNPLHYRADWWKDVGVKPDSWDQIREGARKIKEKHGGLAGFGLARELDSNMTLRGLLWSYGAAEQDEAGRVTISSKATVEAIKLMTAIFKESMSPDVFMWDPSSNNRFFVWGKGSIIQNGISAIRTAERLNPEIAKKTAVAPPAAGPKARLGSVHGMHSYVIWRFAENPDLAKKFLADLATAYSEAFVASEFHNFPAFPNSVSDLRSRLAADKHNPQAYLVLAEAERWSAWPGYPGYATAAIDEVFSSFVIPTMFARVARGEQGAEDSARQAETEMKRIFVKWSK